MKIGVFIILLIFMAPAVYSQILPNKIDSPSDSVEVNWGVEDHEFTDALIYVAKNISQSDKKVFLKIETVWNSDNSILDFSSLAIDIPKNSIVTNIAEKYKMLQIKDPLYLDEHDLRVEVSIVSIY